MATVKRIPTPTGSLTLLVRDGSRWKEEALGVLCQEVLESLLLRLGHAPAGAAAPDWMQEAPSGERNGDVGGGSGVGNRTTE